MGECEIEKELGKLQRKQTKRMRWMNDKMKSDYQLDLTNGISYAELGGEVDEKLSQM